MSRYPITILTVFHPDHWLDMKFERLAQLPHKIRNREAMEKAKEEIAKLTGTSGNVREFHGRAIRNFGRSLDFLRKTWIDGINLERLSACFGEMKPKLVVYTEQGSQAKYRVECRYDWGGEGDALPAENVLHMRDKMLNDKRISVRQLWLNEHAPFAADERMPAVIREYAIPKQIEDERLHANLVLGPHDPHDVLRRANLGIAKTNHVWWVDVL
jgi:hypothetical protein